MRGTFASLFCLGSVAAHGSGAWKDPHHTIEGKPFSGMRYIAEGPPHVLKVVGSDDGESWWSIDGSCSGAGMFTMQFDFSSKGGPPDAEATWAKAADGSVTMTFGDGNAWEMVAETFDSKLVAAPAALRNTIVPVVTPPSMTPLAIVAVVAATLGYAAAKVQPTTAATSFTPMQDAA